MWPHAAVHMRRAYNGLVRTAATFVWSYLYDTWRSLRASEDYDWKSKANGADVMEQKKTHIMVKELLCVNGG